LARYVLDFGSSNGGLTPPAFGWFRDAATHAALPPPAIYASASPAWTYYFDYSFPVPTSPLTTTIEYGVTLAGVGLTDAFSVPGYTPTRFYLDFGRLNGNRTPPVFSWYRDAVTKVAVAPPALTANAAPAWNYYFDAVFPSGTTSIEFGISLAFTSLSEVISAGQATGGQGGAMTLLALRNLVRQESDTENDPHIGEAELTSWINQSRFRLYDKLITMFGDHYYVAQAQFTTDGQGNSFPLPDGTLYGGAPPFYKGELLEAVSGGNVQPNAPITLNKFNLREKNRYMRPLSILAVPNMFPRYDIVGSNIIFTPLPSGGLVCNLWYAPKLSLLVNDTDVADDWSGWLEMVVVDCAIKAIGKQERDATLLVARKQEIVAEIEAAARNRNLGDPNTVIVTEGESGPFGGMPPNGSWGGGFW
jgi:hypothetical protein